MTLNEKINKAVSSQKEFSETVYTSLNNALEELEIREKDSSLDEKLSSFIKSEIPPIMRDGKRAVFFRQVMTPNFETWRFIGISDSTNLKLTLWEFHDDKFTSNNLMKCRLGKMSFHHGIQKDGQHKRSYKNIIDFHLSDGKKIKDVNTLWGQKLTDFHRDLFRNIFPGIENNFFDASEWLKNNGATADKYYIAVLSLFIKHGILFENFTLNGKELDFVKNIFLPAFFEVWEKTGKKPLIVDLSPTTIEGDTFWLSHPAAYQQYVEHIRD